jgi:hypothetical protein
MTSIFGLRKAREANENLKPVGGLIFRRCQRSPLESMSPTALRIGSSGRYHPRAFGEDCRVPARSGQANDVPRPQAIYSAGTRSR